MRYLFWLKTMSITKSIQIQDAMVFLRSQLGISVDARIFEITSFAIIKSTYQNQWVSLTMNGRTEKHQLQLYKTGRTNANDGGIDFVMRPLGRFFQVTEVLDFEKHFLDIDKINKFPITFVVKNNLTPEEVRSFLEVQASIRYPGSEVRHRYLDAIEEIITIPVLDTSLSNFEKNIRDQLLTADSATAST